MPRRTNVRGVRRAEGGDGLASALAKELGVPGPGRRRWWAPQPIEAPEAPEATGTPKPRRPESRQARREAQAREAR